MCAVHYCMFLCNKTGWLKQVPIQTFSRVMSLLFRLLISPHFLSRKHQLVVSDFYKIYEKGEDNFPAIERHHQANPKFNMTRKPAKTVVKTVGR